MRNNDIKFESKLEEIITEYANKIENNVAYTIFSIVSYLLTEKYNSIQNSAIIKEALDIIKNDLNLLEGYSLSAFKGAVWKK